MGDIFDPTFLVERPATQRFWVVRASGGTFVQHFRHAGLMAIAHLDSIGLPDGQVNDATALNFERALAAADRDKERSKASITSHAKQAEVFCSIIQIDDLIVTIDGAHLMVGRVLGTPFVDRMPVVLRGHDETEHKMPHRLRRKVAWGPLIRRAQVPIAMEMTLFAHQTVFNIDRYWTSVYHLLYPCFTFEGRLYLSANIQQQEELDNYYIAQLFGLLSGVEVIGKLIASGADDLGNYPSNLPQLRGSLQLSLSSKAEFMSPGTVWSTLVGGGQEILWAAVVYVMVFGGDLKFFKADGILDTHTRQKIWAYVLRLLDAHDFKKLKANLKVDVPRADTEPLQVEAQKKKRTRRKAAVVLEQTEASEPSADK